MSGFAAAISAARAGVRVVVAERNHFPGGVATSGLMCSIGNYFVTRDGTQMTAGLPIEFIDRLVAENGAMKDYLRPTQPHIVNNPEIVKRVMIKMLREANVRTLYGCVLYDVVSEDGKVSACIFHGRDQSFAITANQFVDSSGDLSIIRRAEGKYDEKNDGTTLLNRMANVDVDKIIDWFEDNEDSYSPEMDIPTSLEDTIKNWREFGVLHLPHGGGARMKFVKDALESGEYSDRFGKHAENLKCFGLFSARCNKGIVLINSNWFFGDCYNIIEESEREEEGRLLAEMQSEFLIKHFPGFENSYLLDTAAEIGHRISRTFVGKIRMSDDDFKDGKKFDDVIGLVGEVDRRTDPGLMINPGNIPLSILIGDKPLNAIVGSAKNPSTEKPGMIRGQPGCLVLGQGAGVAAAEAVKQNVPVNAVEVKQVQNELRRQDVVLDM
ncbi:MAG: FAD-dependent oxidoreductase [Chloroflexi bacterium]|nr:FAD-dependent oxidoreductase [Chloroflexota bacterium]